MRQFAVGVSCILYRESFRTKGSETSEKWRKTEEGVGKWPSGPPPPHLPKRVDGEFRNKAWWNLRTDLLRMVMSVAVYKHYLLFKRANLFIKPSEKPWTRYILTVKRCFQGHSFVNISTENRTRSIFKHNDFKYRSPGGTPLRKAPAPTEGTDPASIIAQALKKKFAHRRRHDTNSPGNWPHGMLISNLCPAQSKINWWRRIKLVLDDVSKEYQAQQH